MHASGVVADLWLAEGDVEALRERAAALVDACATDGTRLDDLLVRIAGALPEIGAMFDVHVAHPDHLAAIADHAKELLILRNLREIQDAARARSEAQASEAQVRRLTEQSRRDPLTGVYNRLQMEEVLDREFQVSRVREFRPQEAWLARLVRGARSEVRALVQVTEPFALLPY